MPSALWPLVLGLVASLIVLGTLWLLRDILAHALGFVQAYVKREQSTLAETYRKERDTFDE